MLVFVPRCVELRAEVGSQELQRSPRAAERLKQVRLDPLEPNLSVVKLLWPALAKKHYSFCSSA